MSRQAIQTLKDLKFEVAESMYALELIKKGKKYLLSPVLNWDKSGDKEKNKETLNQNKTEFYTHLFNIGVNHMVYLEWLFIPLMTLMKYWQTRLK